MALDGIQSLYDPDKNGPRASIDGELSIVSDLIAWHSWHSLPLPDAIDLVVSKIVAALPGISVYLTCPRKYADRIADTEVFRESREFVPAHYEERVTHSSGWLDGRPAGPRIKRIRVGDRAEQTRVVGAADLLQEFRKHWLQSKREEVLYLHQVRKGLPAILQVDAEALFNFNIGLPKLIPSLSEHAIGAADDQSKVVQPAGGSWPRKKGTTWTEAERAAVSKMRIAGLTEVAIASVVGVSRTLVTQECGPPARTGGAAAFGALTVVATQSRPAK